MSRHQKLLAGLTPEQREAVLHTEGPLLILAGAGSGKTRTVTRRIARLVADGVDPTQILAITFTNKAAGEMRERVASLLGVRLGARGRGRKGAGGDEGRMPLVSTFHAFAVRLLREHAPRLGWPARFQILDPGEQLGLVREASVEARVDLKKHRTPDLAHALGRAKERLDDEAFTRAALSDLDRAAAAVLPRYRALQRARGGMDFEDLVAEAVRLLEQDDEVRAEVQDRLRFVLIDEYQDTNHSQYRLARALAGQRCNVAVCGDPDQSIYGWRGADMGNILRFEEDFPGARVLLLEHNYRSTATILRASNHLIRHNLERREKELRPTGAEGAAIEVVACLDAEQEAEYVARAVEQAIADGTPPREVAVVFRAAIHARGYEDALVRRGVPCAMSGGTSFCERAAVKDALSWVRLALNDRDDLAALRALRCAGGVGKRTVDKLQEAQRALGVPLLEACRRAEQVPGLTAPTRERLGAFAAQVSGLASSAARGIEALVAGAVDLLPVGGEPRRAPRDDQAPAPSDGGVSARSQASEAERRASDLRRLLDAARAADARGGRPDARARTFLDRLALLDAREDSPAADEDGGRVTLTTVHASKGLEFGVVFCVGLEEELFPHRRALAEGALEEERRLAYVAFTRAKERLVLCYAATRSGRGESARRPSRFLYELPGELLWDPILREPMVLPERDARPEPTIAARPHGRAPRAPTLARRGLTGGLIGAKGRRPEPAAATQGEASGGEQAERSSARPRWARGLIRRP
ncbi:MAG: ATP-dependent helicase [Planctomycetota bacterium]